MRIISAAFVVGRGSAASLAMETALHLPRLRRVEATRWCQPACCATHADDVAERLPHEVLAQAHGVLAVAVYRVHAAGWDGVDVGWSELLLGGNGY